MKRPIRIANCSGFYGDRLSAAREMVLGGPIDVLTGDYLAELTMSILWKARERDPSAGYATTFLHQAEEVLRPCAEQGIKIVTNAGGLNPAGLAAALRELCHRLGVDLDVVHIEGDDICDSIATLQRAGHDFKHMDTGQSLAEAGFQPVTANVYLGSWAIVEALDRGADVVVCPRVTDAALTVGPAAWHHGWSRTDWNELAGAVVAGHVIECGTQATGGNFSFFDEIDQLRSPGFPIAEVEADGATTITKHPGTDGAVTRETVLAQLLYEVGPQRYLTPDVTARLDTVTLESAGEDRVRIAGVQGEPPPPEAKVAVNYHGGYHNSMTLGLCGLDVERKAALAVDALLHRLGGPDEYAQFETQLSGCRCNEQSHVGECFSYLTVHVRDPDRTKVGKRFTTAFTELGLANYPGLFFTTPPARERAYAVYWPSLLDASVVEQVVVDAGGHRTPVPLAGPTSQDPSVHDAASMSPEPEADVAEAAHDVVAAPLGRAFGARSGDKGGNANLGVWSRRREGYDWLVNNLSVQELGQLLPETRGYDVVRYELPNLWAVNFVITGFLGAGVSSNNRIDAQAKSLSEQLRAQEVRLPKRLVDYLGAEEGGRQ